LASESQGRAHRCWRLCSRGCGAGKFYGVARVSGDVHPGKGVQPVQRCGVR
jgi:hypothetical protein